MKLKFIALCLAALVIPACGSSSSNKLIKSHGRIELDEVYISSKITGRIVALDIKEGDAVRKDQALGQLDLYDKRKKDLDRAESLFASGAIPESKLEEARIALRDQAFIAPIDGTVLLKVKSAGETVSPGQTIVSLGNLNDIYAKVYIPEKEVGRVKLGQVCRVRTDSFPDRAYDGQITYIADTAEFTPKNVQTEDERARRVYAIKIKLANLQQELKPGMSCDADIIIE